MTLSDKSNSENVNEKRVNQGVDDAQYSLRDADNHSGVVPDDALQKVNPSAAARVSPDQDPHHVAKSKPQYDTDVTESDN
ncbi:hypothetical protein [Psychrobacter pygoscelis]|uniref:hypothetical protein n=1 Tax=Psychrobacter pygoscelis TaxID=2488563 RepID=UPI00103FD776|nr:hypothetical protein [Psychrobacter pygoscelis]